MLAAPLFDLPLSVETMASTRLEGETTSDFTRFTTEITLQGDGLVGRGEDVAYDETAHEDYPSLSLPATDTLGGFLEQLTDDMLFPAGVPAERSSRNFRRWGVESAALDLALRQNDETLASALELTADPVRFVVSTRLEDPPSGAVVERWLDRDPTLGFKLDPTDDWTAETVTRLVETDAVEILDMKGQYEPDQVERPTDSATYERVLSAFPDAIIEDPRLTEETRPLVADHEKRVSWDYPIRAVTSIENLPWEPEWLNIKPSRFDSLRELFQTIEYCLDRGIELYGGGQFELGVGRDHLQTLASLFYPDGPNDIAPRRYNVPEPGDALPGSPLEPRPDRRGLSFS